MDLEEFKDEVRALKFRLILAHGDTVKVSENLLPWVKSKGVNKVIDLPESERQAFLDHMRLFIPRYRVPAIGRVIP